VIDTATNTVVATIAVGSGPVGVTFNPAGTLAYVANEGTNNVSVIDTMSNTVVATIQVGTSPWGVAVR
jgi:YVTN family beta-propeller protein